jgi:hypothetical protein
MSVEINAVARRVGFHVEDDGAELIPEAAPVRSVVLRGFEEVSLPAVSARIANPAKYDLRRDAYAEDAWRPLAVKESLIIHPRPGESGRITLQSAGIKTSDLLLDRIFPGVSDVQVEAPEKDYVSLEFRGRHQRGVVRLPLEVQVVADFCLNGDRPFEYDKPSVTIWARLPANERFLKFSSGPSGILVGLEFFDQPDRPSLARDVRIREVEFLDQSSTGSPVSTLTSSGTIAFPQYPALPIVRLEAGHFLTLKGPDGFYLRSISRSVDSPSLSLRLQGLVTTLESGPPGALEPRLPTWFDLLSKSPTLTALFTVIGWLVPTLVAIRKYYRDRSA